ncbi:hypothetical protein GUJ93_ZPchr0001g29745 [Zizania palustris]|uniref:DUF674 family protein n=1 Tax=Zizania palustris TaxID=103762 RepID=A0A8J5SDZ5_ZIZPA|nr:hypothetical protein GUJ93_ZPchr0001g29745 [Zizania palustris]
MDATSAVLAMKLLIDTKAHRVLFAEAGKDVVDFLFSLIALPVATTVKLLGTDSMVGCVGNLYISVEKLYRTYVPSGPYKDALLRSEVRSPAAASSSSVPRLPAASLARSKSFFVCALDGGFSTSCRGYVPTWRRRTALLVQAAGQVVSPAPAAGQVAQNDAAAGGAKGFVQGTVAYTVMDDLTVCPMSSISSITLLNTFAVKDVAALQEKTVQLGYKEGLTILMASLRSKTVLTDVFLAPRPAMRATNINMRRNYLY